MVTLFIIAFLNLMKAYENLNTDMAAKCLIPSAAKYPNLVVDAPMQYSDAINISDAFTEGCNILIK